MNVYVLTFKYVQVCMQTYILKCIYSAAEADMNRFLGAIRALLFIVDELKCLKTQSTKSFQHFPIYVCMFPYVYVCLYAYISSSQKKYLCLLHSIDTIWHDKRCNMVSEGILRKRANSKWSQFWYKLEPLAAKMLGGQAKNISKLSLAHCWWFCRPPINTGLTQADE